MSEIRPFPVSVPEAQLDDLRARLARTRWPEAETDSSQGLDLDLLRSIVAYWQQTYDWRRCEARLNAAGSFVTELDGLDIHFLHQRSPHPEARPLILTHGWPGSVIEFMSVIPALTTPEAHGGDVQDAFHVVVPALPGYGFSQKPSRPGWKVARIARAWSTLMTRLGYDRYFAQGGDWGAMVTTELAKLDGCAACHLNLVIARPPADVLENPTEAEMHALMKVKAFRAMGSAYALQQASRPQTLGYALVDSPVGQAAWILDKFDAWSESGLDSVGLEPLLDNVTLYWLTASGASSARLYWESFVKPDVEPIEAPVGMTIFPGEMQTPSRRWAANRFSQIIYWNEAEAGGHFAALEQPALFVQELRACFRDRRLTERR